MTMATYRQDAHVSGNDLVVAELLDVRSHVEDLLRQHRLGRALRLLGPAVIALVQILQSFSF